MTNEFEDRAIKMCWLSKMLHAYIYYNSTLWEQTISTLFSTSSLEWFLFLNTLQKCIYVFLVRVIFVTDIITVYS